MNKDKTYKDAWDELTSPAYWWFVCMMEVLLTCLSAINRWIIHIPTFPKW